MEGEEDEEDEEEEAAQLRGEKDRYTDERRVGAIGLCATQDAMDSTE